MRRGIESSLADFCEADTTVTREGLMVALAEATLVFPVAPPSEGAGMRIAFTNDQAGRPVLPAFSDQDHLLRWQPQGFDVASAPASGFLPTVLSGPFVGLLINSQSEAAVFISREAIQRLVDGSPPSDGDVIEHW